MKGTQFAELRRGQLGVRWWQISKEKVPQFVQVLRRNENSAFEDEMNMVARGIGLLTRDYKSKMLARNGNGRWVVYERRGLPWLIDTTTDTEELLGWPRDESTTSEGMLVPALGNEPLGCSSLAPNQRSSCVFSSEDSALGDDLDLGTPIRATETTARDADEIVEIEGAS
jgi:hypothetical protein